MDVSAKTIREVEFREKLRGYHQDDVDDFLERLATGVETLHERLRQATERAVRAEQESASRRDEDDSLRRTLVLAQRTADLAVNEGREQAARLVSTAEDEATSLVSNASAEAARMIEDAQARVRRDVAQLEAARAQLQGDVDTLVSFLDDERARVKAVLHDAARQLDEVLPPRSRPVVDDVDVPEESAGYDVPESRFGMPSQPGDAGRPLSHPY